MTRTIVGLIALTTAVVLRTSAQELPALRARDLGAAALVGGTLIDGTQGKLTLDSVILISCGIR